MFLHSLGRLRTFGKTQCTPLLPVEQREGFVRRTKLNNQLAWAWHTGYMRTSPDIETAIAVRCAELGLTRQQAQALADGEPFPIDLVHVLGLNPDTLEPLRTKRWLWMATQSSSVSYRAMLTPDMLLATLISGDVLDEFRAHVAHFLNDVPIQLVVMAIEQAAQQSGVPIARIWRSVALLNKEQHGRRLVAVGESICLGHAE